MPGINHIRPFKSLSVCLGQMQFDAEAMFSVEIDDLPIENTGTSFAIGR